jgi:hypothetical protein
MLSAWKTGPTARSALPVFLLVCVATGGLAFLPARAAVVPWLSLEEMTARAEIIVLGKVEEATGAWSEDGRIIVTRVTASVERSLKGGPRVRVAFEVPGGSVDGQRMVASGAPVFRVGERVVVFLGPAGDRAAAPGSRRLAVVGWNLGKMDVRRDARTGRDLVQPGAGGTTYLDRDGKPVSGQTAAGPVELGRYLREIEDLAERDRKAGAE